MRGYLLGVLSGPAARALEERYLSSREGLLEIQSVETALIEDYLNRRLSSTERARFEGRYLRIANLRERVAEISELHRQKESARKTKVLGWTLACAVAVTFIAGLAYSGHVFSGHVFMDRKAPSDAIPIAREAPLQLDLSPGVKMGGRPSVPTLTFPAHSVSIKLSLDTPGRETAFKCKVTVSQITGDGKLKPVWTSPSFLDSTPVHSGQKIVAVVDSIRLERGEYDVEVITMDGSGEWDYIFRAVPVPANPKNDR